MGEDAVILDIGSKFIRAGYGGEARPRVIYPNQVYDEHVQVDAHNLGQYEYCQSVKVRHNCLYNNNHVIWVF